MSNGPMSQSVERIYMGAKKSIERIQLNIAVITNYERIKNSDN